jgi:hypothetical protein
MLQDAIHILALLHRSITVPSGQGSIRYVNNLNNLILKYIQFHGLFFGLIKVTNHYIRYKL